LAQAGPGWTDTGEAAGDFGPGPGSVTTITTDYLEHGCIRPNQRANAGS
jgi:hypothetical protein